MNDYSNVSEEERRRREQEQLNKEPLPENPHAEADAGFGAGMASIFEPQMAVSLEGKSYAYKQGFGYGVQEAMRQSGMQHDQQEKAYHDRKDAERQAEQRHYDSLTERIRARAKAAEQEKRDKSLENNKDEHDQSHEL